MSTGKTARQYARWAEGGMAGAIAAVILLLAPCAASGQLKSSTMTPPYKGAAASETKVLSISGPCKTTAALTALHWLPKHANITSVASASAKGCGTPPTGGGYSWAYVFAIWQLAIPVRVNTSAPHNFSAKFAFDYTPVTALAGVPTCPAAKPSPGSSTYSACWENAVAGSTMGLQLYDATNRTLLDRGWSYFFGPYNSTYFENFSSCTPAGACTSSYSSAYCASSSVYPFDCVPSGTPASGSNSTYLNTGDNCGSAFGPWCFSWQNWTLNRSHSYWAIAIVEVFVFVDVGGYGPGHSAIASVNGATFGNRGWRVTSLTVA